MLAAVRRVTTTLALALCLLGCSAAQSGRSATPSGGSAAPLEAPVSAAPSGYAVSPTPSSDTVELRTAEWAFPERSDGGFRCPNDSNVGLLIVDPEYGTAAQNADGIHPLIWPLGYTARRLPGGEVAVLRSDGAPVAITGRKYRFWAPHWGGGGGPVEAGACVLQYDEGEIQTPPG
jgi:hypothetical protein